ncbi:MAG: hypothetical protein HKN09_03660, partial [Saprospiraceae bacterium]|nr:hypothetical protein [Saprospiraceae bacterium]
MSQFYFGCTLRTCTKSIVAVVSVSICLFFFNPIQAQFTIFTEDFEDHGNSANGGAGRYTSTNDFYESASDDDYWGRVNGNTEEYFLTNVGTGLIANTQDPYDGFNGNFYYAGEDLDDTGGTIGNPDGSAIKELSITGINITGGTNLVFKALLAVGDDDGCTASEFDSGDYIRFYYTIDGGVEQTGICFAAALNCPGGGNTANEPLFDDPDCNGDGIDGSVMYTSTFAEFQYTIPSVGSSLDLRVEARMNSGDEEIAFDFFRVESDTPIGGGSVCPTIGSVVTSPLSICEGDNFDIDASGLMDMDMASNMDMDFGIEFVAFTSTPADPYIGGTSLGIVPFGSLTGGGTMASVTNTSLAGAGSFEIYAILNPTPTDMGCRPSAMTTLDIMALPTSPMVSNVNVCIGESTNIIPATNPGGDVWEEDFEMHGNTENGGTGAYTSLNDFWDGTSDYWGRVNGPTMEYYLNSSTLGNTISTQDAYSGWNGSFFYAGEDLDDGGSTEGSGITNPVRELSITGIDITGESNLMFKALLAVGDDDGCNASEFDSGDYIRFYYTIDGGVEQTGICFAGALNCPGGNTTNEPLFDDPDCNGDGIDGSMMINSTFAEVEFNIPGSGSSLDIRVEVSMNSGDEEIAMDYFRVIAGPSGPMTFNFYDGDPDLGGTLLAGNVTSYDPMTTPATSPESIWVTGLEGGCESDAVEVVVTVGGGLNISTGSYGPLCEDDTAITLTGMPAPGAGETAEWTGTGVTDPSTMDATASFDPTGLNGNYTLTYTVTDVNGCSSFGSTSVAVNSLPTVDAGSDFSTCNNDEPSILSGTPVPTAGETGEWTGSGVTDGNNMDATASFDPTGLSGPVIVSYTFTDINGCSASDTRTVTVNVAPTANAGSYPDVAENAPDVMLTGVPTPGAGETGEWTGTGVTDPSNMDETASFDPSGLSGPINLTYTFTDANGCFDSDVAVINVTAAVPVSTGSYAPVCEDAADVVLIGTPDPGPGETGTWTGMGVTDPSNTDATAFFDPTGLSGNITITYTYVDINGRDESASTTITVNDLPTVNFTAPADLCINAGVQAGLGSGMPSGTGGEYSGDGVSDDGNGMTYSFDPAMAGVGTHTLTYTYTDANGCMNSASDDIEVFDIPVVSFTAPADLCENEGEQTGLSGGSPSSGVYSGTGVMDDGNGMTYSFDPTGLSGTITITYTFTDANGCTDSASDDIFVFDTPMVSFTAPADLCIDAGTQAGLGSGTPTGGMYSGDGVMDDGNGMTYSFDPADAGAGVHILTYTYTDVNGCTNTASDDIEVFPLPTVSFTAPADLCKDAGVQSGLGGGMPSGGIYSGPGVMDDGNGSTYSFDPQAAGTGIKTISYTYTDANGCTDTASDDIEVFPIPVSPAVTDIFVCLGESTEIIPENSGDIWVEDFETNGNEINGGDSRYNSPGDFYDGSSDHWGRVEGASEEFYLTDMSSGSTISPTVSYTNWNGNFYYAGEDLDDTGGD